MTGEARTPSLSRARRVALVVAALVLVAACGDGRGGDQARSRTTATTSSPTSASMPPPTAAVIDKPCLRAGEAAGVFRFTTSDGATLVGMVLGSGRTGLVLGHQLGSDLCEWLPQARAFARRGYRVLVFDFAGFGDSQSGPDGRVDTDVVAATAELRRRGAGRVVLVGSSMGGTAVLSAATRIRPLVAGVVSLSGPSGFGGVDAQGAMARLRVPVLFVVAADDQHFTEQARLLYRAARVADKRLLVVPGGGHGTSMVEFGDDAPRVLATLRRFVADHTRP
jgi:pimeloyl-ACP methyl ester carboxylesterase